MKSNFVVAIPTYKRAQLLQLLIGDIFRQSLQPDQLIVIDGDPASGEVLKMLQALNNTLSVSYVPSNHGNLAYQRYLGWRVASDLKATLIVYFDDDERILQPSVLSWLVKPFAADNVVGVGCEIRFGAKSDGSDASNVRRAYKPSRVARLFGSGRYTVQGSISPVGHRIPLNDDRDKYQQIEWLRGGAMAFRMSAIELSTFSDDLFALDRIRCGLGEDTFLSRRVGAKGKLLYTFRAIVDHPNADTPKSYPYEAYKYAYAATYSRRFLNDYYRVYHPPTLADRWALVKSYAGNTMLAWWRVITKPSRLNLSLACGTTFGALHGLTRPPTAKRLTPHIDWWADAEAALKQAVVIQNGNS